MANMDIPAVPICEGKVSVGTYEGHPFWSTVSVKHQKDGKTTLQVAHVHYDPSKNKPSSVNRELLRDVVLHNGLCDFMDEQLGGKWQMDDSKARNSKIKMVAKQILSRNPKLVVHLGRNLFGGINETPTLVEVEAALALLQGKSGIIIGQTDDAVDVRTGDEVGVLPSPLAKTSSTDTTVPRMGELDTPPERATSTVANVQDTPSNAHRSSDVSIPRNSEGEPSFQRATPTAERKATNYHPVYDMTTQPHTMIKQEVLDSPTNTAKSKDKDRRMRKLQLRKKELALRRDELELEKDEQNLL
ncbi:hypothetical protein LTR15_008782 [Elasticomyces elasticus]|nr:hypothetical protein LTR15_008782 [Elasticomyces elasticus]